MLIKSQAGEFEISVSGFEKEGDDLVIIGAMGVWEARTHATPRELASLIGKIIGSRIVWAYMFKLPFLLRRRLDTGAATDPSSLETKR